MAQRSIPALAVLMLAVLLAPAPARAQISLPNVPTQFAEDCGRETTPERREACTREQERLRAEAERRGGTNLGPLSNPVESSPVDPFELDQRDPQELVIPEVTPTPTPRRRFQQEPEPRLGVTQPPRDRTRTAARPAPTPVPDALFYNRYLEAMQQLRASWQFEGQEIKTFAVRTGAPGGARPGTRSPPVSGPPGSQQPGLAPAVPEGEIGVTAGGNGVGVSPGQAGSGTPPVAFDAATAAAQGSGAAPIYDPVLEQFIDPVTGEPAVVAPGSAAGAFPLNPPPPLGANAGAATGLGAPGAQAGVQVAQVAPGRAAFGSQATTLSSRNPNLLARTGDILFARLINRAYSRAPAPILAEIASPGPMNGARLLGTFTQSEDRLLMEFSYMVLRDGRNAQVSSVAIDPKTSLTTLADDVDRHYFERFFLAAAAEFIAGFAGAIAQTDQIIVQSDEGSVSTSQTEQSTAEAVAQGAARAVEGVSADLDAEFQKYQIPTVVVREGTLIGLILLQDIIAQPGP